MSLQSQPQIPRFANFEIRINNSVLSFDDAAHAVNIIVDDDVNLPSLFTIEMEGLNQAAGKIAYIDDSRFQVGHTVEIRLGYGKLETLMQGEITGLEPGFVYDRLPTLKIRGYDRRHRLQRGGKTRTFVQQKDSAIATQIANEANLTAQVQDTGVIHDYVMQGNQTDWEFLQERAKYIQYEVKVNDRTLLFQPVAHAESETLTLTWESDLWEFYPQLSTVGQVTEVTVRGWNPQDKVAIAESAKKGAEVTKMGGQQTGVEVSETFGQAVEIVSDRPLATVAEAQQLAQAYFNQNVLAFITGEGTCRGKPQLRAGNVIAIQGIGQRFSGRYYVTSARHHYQQKGYKTHFTVQRNAI